MEFPSQIPPWKNYDGSQNRSKTGTQSSCASQGFGTTISPPVDLPIIPPVPERKKVNSKIGSNPRNPLLDRYKIQIGKS